MALPRYLFRTGLISAKPPLDVGVSVLKRPEITRAQDLNAFAIKLQ